MPDLYDTSSLRQADSGSRAGRRSPPNAPRNAPAGASAATPAPSPPAPAPGLRPYYSEDGITIYHGDARDILPQLDPVDVVITDPVWPNAVAELAGSDDPAGLFAEAARYFPEVTSRVVVHLGCDSDPRFLAGMPDELPYLRTCWLEYARPHFKGHVMYGSDVAYVFGVAPARLPGQTVIPGRMMHIDSVKKVKGHPCPRQLSHLRWLVKWFARGPVLDPFCGTGTTLLAAKLGGWSAVGIEIEERYCELAARRLTQGMLWEAADAPARAAGGKGRGEGEVRE